MLSSHPGIKYNVFLSVFVLFISYIFERVYDNRYSLICTTMRLDILLLYLYKHAYIYITEGVISMLL